jgi:MFS superfamily sulfate permease-like transporter
VAPALVGALRGYSRRTFFADLTAGITVGLVALPLAMAFAISSGVPPQAGLYTAVVAGFLISALGGFRTQIGGPTGAFVVVVFGIVARHGIDGLFVCTLMAGVMLVLLGVTGLGTVVKFLPRPVVIGFTNGIAVLIASTQVKDFFGLRVEKGPGEFLGRVKALAALLYIRKVTHTTTVGRASKDSLEDSRPHILTDRYIPAYVTVIHINGPFLFGATDKLLDEIDRAEELTPVVVLRLRNMTAIDTSGLLALEDAADKLHAAGRTLILCGARPQPARLMQQAEFERHVGAENVCPDITSALVRAETLYLNLQLGRRDPVV